MVYRALGLMSGSSLDGLDMAFVEFHEAAGKWSYSVLAADCFPYTHDLEQRLQSATQLSARDYLLLHSEYGHYIGKQVNQFIEKHALDYQVQLIASHGHTSFHLPAQRTTAQLGDGAAIAATTGINVVSDLRSVDIALGGQGAPIVPIGEKLLWPDYEILLNLGGIANLSFASQEGIVAFDVCAANRVLNLLAQEKGLKYDDRGQLAVSGQINHPLLEKLNQLDYYQASYPKSLANDFGTDTVYPILQQELISTEDKLRTYTQHIAYQLKHAIQMVNPYNLYKNEQPKLLVTGGGAHNDFLVNTIRTELAALNLTVEVPSKEVVDFKEAIVMALIGVLRWRENNNVLASVTGAKRDSIGGAVYIGQTA